MSTGEMSFSRPFEIGRKAEISIRLSEFEIPPIQDVLVVGKKAPIGPEAVKRMVDALSPEQYVVIRLEHDVFEAAVLKKSLLKFIPQDKLLPIILKECSAIATEDSVIKAQLNIVVQVNKVVDL
ncbi:hypothetical protein SAMN02745218_02141 [Desulfofundulus australicus DSM 11792]|jgi:hypothetical protein|uniref:Uncharacterized protein n=1 Tax=Desulfofundulus australicus DSM 11792 TaxID=1121425 RepID=A0A1M5B9K1_9FIRM|nr:hypothetical protein [Desulfofundulus australicus]SHF39100.1 hypothetical protein SAMN02745218_02141 [Desulfofundulus australicus DSM 11792]